MNISDLIFKLIEIKILMGEVEVVVGDYEEISRRGRVVNNISPVHLEIIEKTGSNDMGENDDPVLLISDGMI